MVALAAGSVLSGTATQASVIPLPNLVPVVIPSGTGSYSQAGSPGVGGFQGTDDPSLSGYCTYDIQVVISSASGVDRFASADLRAQLSAGGQFYIPPSNDSNFVQPVAARNSAPTRFLQVDTMIMVPGVSSAIAIFGKSAFAPMSQTGAVMPSNGSNLLDPYIPNGTVFEPANSMRLVDASWVTPNSNVTPTTGTYTIARLTFKMEAGEQCTFIGRVGHYLNPSTPVSFTYIVGVVPEPTTVGVFCLATGSIALRRRRSLRASRPCLSSNTPS
jgi:hypothetical protein